MGRYKKENAIKAGDLQKGLQRFSFIAHREVIRRLKLLSKEDQLSIKDLMDKILSQYIEGQTSNKIDRQRFNVKDVIPENKDEEKLLSVLRNKKTA